MATSSIAGTKNGTLRSTGTQYSYPERRPASDLGQFIRWSLAGLDPSKDKWMSPNLPSPTHDMSVQPTRERTLR